MRFVLFAHSLVSDWNHGNAHFLRGVVSELLSRGHDVRVFEPNGGWSLSNLLAEEGEGPIRRFERAYPGLSSIFYSEKTLDLDWALDGADAVLVHEWNAPELVARIGAHRSAVRSYRLYFHDTHHRALTDPAAMERYDLSGYDGVLAFGAVLKDLYLARCWTRAAWVWHEAADVRVFKPCLGEREQAASRGGVQLPPVQDLVWIGNWGDDERTSELSEFLLEPARELSLSGTVHGVRYPHDARERLSRAGLSYRGWVANFDVPRVFSRHRFTVHVPRRPYVAALPGIPTIRPFEALACGIPLISAPWEDAEGLFEPGADFLVAKDGAGMRQAMRTLLSDPSAARELARSGLHRIRSRHTCAHRVDELLSIHASLGPIGECDPKELIA